MKDLHEAMTQLFQMLYGQDDDEDDKNERDYCTPMTLSASDVERKGTGDSSVPTTCTRQKMEMGRNANGV
eukprot:6787653-Ditylum_brightwellii.AAC.1